MLDRTPKRNWVSQVIERIGCNRMIFNGIVIGRTRPILENTVATISKFY